MMMLGDYRWLHGLWVLPILAGLLLWAIAARRRSLRRFVAPALSESLSVGVSPGRAIGKGAILLATLALIIAGLTRPLMNPQPQEVQTVGRDVCFMVDVSRSMLAEDLAPNRLERAAMWIRDTLDVVHGDRVALIAFAGNAVVKCPLTHDYGYMRMAIDDLSTSSVTRGGTFIGDAIRLALDEVFELEKASHKDIILITDGEDHESFPIEAAGAAGEAGVRIIAIGIGGEDEGARVPIRDAFNRPGFLTYEGEEVRTRLDAETLKKVALASRDGVYLNVATGSIQLDTVYQELVQQAEKHETAREIVMRYEEGFQIFIALALGLLILEGLIREGGAR